ncbi:MAG: helix-turn-helix domain-containing protein [Eubacteriales bacterium]|nr:helix-turn-helix domain-containing protein [Eubacteriales bacterium]
MSYKPLFRQLLERDIKKMGLLRAAKISTSTLSKLGKNEPVKLEMLMRVCEALHCRIEDVIEFVDD